MAVVRADWAAAAIMPGCIWRVICQVYGTKCVYACVGGFYIFEGNFLPWKRPVQRKCTDRA